MEVMTKQRVLKTLEQLPEKETEQLIDYLDFLVWKSKQEESHPKTTGKNPIALRVIEAIEKSNEVTMEDAEALLQSIKEGEIPMRFDSPFKDLELKDQEDQ